MTGRRPSLSACLIVRDEAAMLPGCLQSLAGVVDEQLVVDTGSTDETITIAVAHGARVERFAWVDDFAAARNAALAAARGDFVLVIDADERLAAEAGAVIRAVIDAEPPDAPPTVYLPLIENIDAAGRPLGADHMPRLWRRRPGLAFVGRVHEQLVAAEGALRRVYDDRIRLIHLGYDPVIAAARDKRRRNRALLLAEQADRPDDVGVIYHLAKEDYAAGDDAAALAGFERVAAAGSTPLALSAALFAVECLRHLDRSAEAVAVARRALAGAADYGELWYAAAQAALEGGDPATAAELVRGADRSPAGIAGAAFRDLSVRAWRADLLRARIARAGGDLDVAARGYAAVRDRLPPDARAAADLDAAEVEALRGEAEAAWALIAPYVEAAPADAAEALVVLVQAFIEHAGLAAAYHFVVDLLAARPVLSHQLPIVGAAAELAEAVGDEAGRSQWLQRCVLCESPHPEHHAALAALLDADGRRDEAAAVRRRAPEGGR